jgi:hypothetical protein
LATRIPYLLGEAGIVFDNFPLKKPFGHFPCGDIWHRTFICIHRNQQA